MARKWKRIGALVGGATLLTAAALATLGGSAEAVEVTFPGVVCTSPAGNQTLDITVSVDAPTQVTAGETFTITFPSLTSELPSTALGGAITISSYQNLFTTYDINGTTFNAGSESTGNATIDGTPTAFSVSYPAPDNIQLGVAGPIPPGTLVTPTTTVTATAGAAGSTITINALTLTTSAVIGTSPIPVTCTLPTTTLLTINVVAATTTTAAPTTTAGPTTTTTAGPTTTTTAGPTTTTTVGPTTTTTTVPTTCKPGWGYGDKNHCHSGPPGLMKKQG
jgi:hypothetical protein